MATAGSADTPRPMSGWARCTTSPPLPPTTRRGLRAPLVRRRPRDRRTHHPADDRGGRIQAARRATQDRQWRAPGRRRRRHARQPDRLAVRASLREARDGPADADWRGSFDGQAMLPGCNLPDCSHGLVFTREDGSPLRPDYVTKHLNVIARKAGLPPKRLHDLRHASASFQLASGVQVATVSKRLGHSQIALTVNTKRPPVPRGERRAAERAPALIPRASQRQDRLPK
jgi:integrase